MIEDRKCAHEQIADVSVIYVSDLFMCILSAFNRPSGNPSGISPLEVSQENSLRKSQRDFLEIPLGFRHG